jgi:predicted nuclease of predicted toxin-antitoxin system
MRGFLVDEDLPRNLAELLRQRGHNAQDVRDVGLRGQADSRIFAYASQNELALVTADVEFAHIHKYPPGTHHGIVLLRFPSEAHADVLRHVTVTALSLLEARDIAGNIVVVEPGQIRIHGSHP